MPPKRTGKNSKKSERLSVEKGLERPCSTSFPVRDREKVLVEVFFLRRNLHLFQLRLSELWICWVHMMSLVSICLLERDAGFCENLMF